MEALLKGLMLRVNTALYPKRLSKHNMVQRPLNPTDHVVSLLKWTERVLMYAGMIALFGTKILEIDPDLVQEFLVFNDEN